MIDLHLHTNSSDGTQTVQQLLTRAQDMKLDVISITDHNSVDGYDVIKKDKCRNLFNGQIIVGSEMYFCEQGINNEILGYGLDTDTIKSSPLFDTDIKRQQQMEFLDIGYEVFKNVGFKMSPISKLQQQVLSSNVIAVDWLIDDAVLHEENKALIEKMGIPMNEQYYFQFIDNENSPLFVPVRKYTPTLKDASKIIRDAGGLVFMAHIFRIPNEEQAKALLDYATSNRLIDGVEVYYRNFTTEQIEYLEKYCKKHNLLMSGGSDAHHLKDPICYAGQRHNSISNNLVEPWLGRVRKI